MTATNIEWTDHTVNPGIYGCEVVSPACTYCYAATMAKRLGAMGQASYAGLTRDRPGMPATWTGEVRVDFNAISPAFAKLPKRKPFRAFVTSMADLFHKDVSDAFIARVFDHMRSRRNGTFQVLTKRPERAVAWWESIGVQFIGHWPGNVWMGATVEDQRRADERIPHLLRVPAPVRFLSCEPLLGPIDLRGLFMYCEKPEPQFWVIAGCESGPKRRHTDDAWLRSLRDQCASAGVPFFLKQRDDLDLGIVVGNPEFDGVVHIAFPGTP